MTKDATQTDQIEDLDKGPVSTRDTIRAAIDEQKDKIAAEELREKPVETQKTDPPVIDKEVSEPTEPTEKAPDKKAEDKKPEQLELDLGDKDKKVETKEPEKKPRVPFGLPKELRADWETLKPEVQGTIAKIVKENLDYKSNEGRKPYLREVDAVLTPYAPAMQHWGVTPAQLVKRLLEYSDALASPQHKYLALARLAQDFGIDLAVYNETNTTQKTQQTQQQQPELTYSDYIPPEVDQKLDTILNEFDQLKAVQRSANDVAAKEYVNTWAGYDPATNEYAKKPYFPYVRQAMQQLIANGTIPIKDNSVDLDAAYDTACYLNPEIRERMAEDRNREIAQIEEQKRQQQIKAAQKAKLAGSSMRSGAPMPHRNATNSGRPNNIKDTSARAAIVAAFNEHRQ